MFGSNKVAKTESADSKPGNNQSVSPESRQEYQFNLIAKFLNEKVNPFEQPWKVGAFGAGKGIFYFGPSIYEWCGGPIDAETKATIEMYERINKARKTLDLNEVEKRQTKRAIVPTALQHYFSKTAKELKEENETIELFRQVLTNESNQDAYRDTIKYFLNDQRLLSRILRMAENYYGLEKSDYVPDFSTLCKAENEWLHLKALEILNCDGKQYGIEWTAWGELTEEDATYQEKYGFGFITEDDEDAKGAAVREQVTKDFLAKYGITLDKDNVLDIKGRSVPCHVFFKRIFAELNILPSVAIVEARDDKKPNEELSKEGSSFKCR